MSKLVIKSENQLLKFLNVLAEESVQQAYSDISGAAQQQDVAKSIRASKKTFIEEEDPPATSEPAQPEAREKAPTSAAPAEPGKASISPKFDSLVDAINDLRGAPSSRDSSVETQLRAYYDKLGDAEAASAILFIRTLSQVMKGEVEGSRAPDPSDYQIITSMEGEEAPAEAPKVAAPTRPIETAPEEAEAPAEEEEEEGTENTAPPIKVGAEQVSEAYRNKIKMLLARG